MLLEFGLMGIEDGVAELWVTDWPLFYFISCLEGILLYGREYWAHE